MQHRHLKQQGYTLPAIDDIIYRGGQKDWLELARQLENKPQLAKKSAKSPAPTSTPSMATNAITSGTIMSHTSSKPASEVAVHVSRQLLADDETAVVGDEAKGSGGKCALLPDKRVKRDAKGRA